VVTLFLLLMTIASSSQTKISNMSLIVAPYKIRVGCISRWWPPNQHPKDASGSVLWHRVFCPSRLAKLSVRNIFAIYAI